MVKYLGLGGCYESFCRMRNLKIENVIERLILKNAYCYPVELCEK
jgi:hypothetical protein